MLPIKKKRKKWKLSLLNKKHSSYLSMNRVIGPACQVPQSFQLLLRDKRSRDADRVQPLQSSGSQARVHMRIPSGDF